MTSVVSTIATMIICIIFAVVIFYILYVIPVRIINRIGRAHSRATRGLFYILLRLFAKAEPAEEPLLRGQNSIYDPNRIIPAHMRDPRRSFSRDVVVDIAQTYGYQCEYIDSYGLRCGETHGLEADHLFPHSHGGRTRYNKNEPLNPFTNNIILLCKDHNRAKSSNHPDSEFVSMVEQSRLERTAMWSRF